MTAQLAHDITALKTAATAAFASPTAIHTLVAAIQPSVTAVLTDAAALRNTQENYYWELANNLNALTVFLAARYPSS
jgi:hypothetical protein